MVAVNLPLDRPTIEGVAEIFSACGEIVLIREDWPRFNICDCWALRVPSNF